LQEGSWGADFYGDLRPDGRVGEFVLDKHRYSAFIATRLDQLLRSNGVQTIVVCGVATTGCVESTIRDGFMHDYYVVIARDACGDYEPVRHENALSKLGLSFGTVMPVADISQCWTEHRARTARSRAGSPAA
jgi:ureidoacrylate peracid hydrolase